MFNVNPRVELEWMRFEMRDDKRVIKKPVSGNHKAWYFTHLRFKQ